MELQVLKRDSSPEAEGLSTACSTNGFQLSDTDRASERDYAEYSSEEEDEDSSSNESYSALSKAKPGTAHALERWQTMMGTCPGNRTHCVAVQTEIGKQDVDTNTDVDAERVLKELVSHREHLKDIYQQVLDKQTQAEKQLQVQIKQMKQLKDDELQKHKDTLKLITELTTKKEETKRRMEKERKEQVQKEHDLKGDLERQQSKTEQLMQQEEELETKIVSLLAEQTKERQEWEAELVALQSVQGEITRNMQEETERAVRAEVLSLESQRDLYMVSLEEAENEAEVTLSCLRVATPTLEWIQLKQLWEARMAGIQQIKKNLREQFESQIHRVKSGCSLSNLPSISEPDLPQPPSDTNLLLQKIALSPLQGAAPIIPSQPRDPFLLQSQILTAFQCQPSPPLPHIPNVFTGTAPVMPTAAAASSIDPPAQAPGTDKLGKILEKLQARFPQCHKAQLTSIMQDIKRTRGTLAGLTVEELCQLVAVRLMETPDAAIRVTLPPGNSRPPFHGSRGIPSSGSFTGKPAQYKMCLICQKLVQPLDLQPMSCTHITHRECIKSLPQTNQRNTCPFCPNQR
ncbi:RING finger protein 214 [Bombina bombina]|uniref:RING finger protein 214 n=1 Tax=Bombina bombina TaxID=8345 RepID=UPI00235B2D5C|nr:RING finger protein 214 [Bombina bombina]